MKIEGILFLSVNKKRKVLNMKLRNLLLILSVVALFVVAGCSKPLAGQAIKFTDDQGKNCVGYKLYISGNGEGTTWQNCKKLDDGTWDATGCVPRDWHYQKGDGTIVPAIFSDTGEVQKGYEGGTCITEFADLDENGDPIGWCATATVDKKECEEAAVKEESVSEAVVGEATSTGIGDGSGSEEAVGDGTGKCGAGLTPCGPNKDCVDTKTDPSNCGACGNWCFSQDKYPGVKDTECVDSVCVMKACKEGFMLKEGKCVKTCPWNGERKVLKSWCQGSVPTNETECTVSGVVSVITEVQEKECSEVNTPWGPGCGTFNSTLSASGKLATCQKSS